MLIHNNGVIGAALALVGIKVPLEFNLDDGLVVNLARVAEANHPTLSKDAHEFLAIVEGARRFAEDLAIRLAAVEKVVEPIVDALPEVAAPAPEPVLVPQADPTGEHALELGKEVLAETPVEPEGDGA